MVGRTISHYKILSEVGRGGMGIVYKAEDEKLKRPVALKFLAAHLLKDEEARKRFDREAKAAAALSHPNICTVHEIDEIDGQTFIAMEFVEGESLDKRIEQGPLKIPEALDIAQQIATGLEAAHKKKIVHRDIKPGNVIVDAEGHVTIVDFGLALLTEGSKLSQLDTTVGTAAYMSPQQIQGMKVDHRTDIWALGCVLYEMICGQRPFKGVYDKALLYEIVNEGQQPLTGLRTGVPVELEWVVGKCLAKTPDERYQDVNNLLVDLRAVRRQVAPSTRDSLVEQVQPQPDRAGERTAKGLYLYGGLAAALVLLVAGALLVESRVSPPDEQAGASSPKPPEASIAVMPLADLSGDEGNEYFSDGLTDELIHTLSRMRGLKVVARGSVFQFKGKQYDIQEVGRKLGVRTALDGSVRRSGDRLRITMQLVNVADGFELWSQQFDREMKDVFAIQGEIARAVADQLSVELVGEDLRPLFGRKTGNLEAYELYLKGISFINEMTPEGIAKAIDVLRRAGRLDPDYAEPHALVATIYANQASMGSVLPSDVLPHAKREALKALELDDRSAQAHLALALVHTWIEWDWSGAEEEFQRAIEISPAYRGAYTSYAQYLSFVGRSDKAIAASRKALELDPLSAGSHFALAFTLALAGRFEEALTESQKTLETMRRFPPVYSVLAMAHLGLGNHQEAIRAAEQGRSLSGDALTQATLGLAYATGGRRADALSILEELKRERNQGHISPFSIALVHEGLGDFDAAFEWLEKAYEEHDAMLPMLNARPKSDPLRADPRAQDLLKRIGLGD